MSLHNFVLNSVQILRLSLFFSALIVFDFSFLKFQKCPKKHDNQNFLINYIENQKILMKKKKKLFWFYLCCANFIRICP